MHANRYHLLAFLPATEAWEMPSAQEAQAQRWVRSGKLRISAEYEKNFVRLGAAESDESFTARELAEPALAEATRARIRRHVAPAEGAEGLQRAWDQLRRDLKNSRGVSAEKEMKIARVLVQSAHPSVIELLLGSGTEVFVSYAHNVADLMRVRDWEGHGENSGMQTTELTGTQVFISAGGDPFFEGTQKNYTTDGFPALARMVVIAGQEFGHFADLRRVRHRGGIAITGRHSLDENHSQMRANPQAARGRLADGARINEVRARYAQAGLFALRRAEKAVAFYHTRRRFSPPWIFCQAWRFLAWVWFSVHCRRSGVWLPLRTHPSLRAGEAIEAFLADMAFNLAPEAEVYRHPDPQVEEAIAVIEAVARVPQQQHKWGVRAVTFVWPNLFAFYYQTIIPANLAVLDAPPKSVNVNILQKLVIVVHRLLRARPGYYPAPGDPL